MYLIKFFFLSLRAFHIYFIYSIYMIIYAEPDLEGGSVTPSNHPQPTPENSRQKQFLKYKFVESEKLKKSITFFFFDLFTRLERVFRNVVGVVSRKKSMTFFFFLCLFTFRCITIVGILETLPTPPHTYFLPPALHL